ncbi:MAG: MFS transporter [Bacteroidetes bacterium]|nr:MFS transporter [Bacteroidota bacterium]
MAGKKNIVLLIVVASLGYFVDIYDLILFNIIKKESMESLHMAPEFGITLFNWQMTGMLIGGLLWGIWGDRKGRVSVLFGSILLYSFANIANAFVSNLTEYSIWRFIAGVGLAGELGAAITLVAENMPTKKRGIGTMIIVTFGALGAVFAFWVSNLSQLSAFIQDLAGIKIENWQTAYIMGGVLGLVLLALRAGTFESSMFHEIKNTKVTKGNFFMLLRDWPTFKKYMACIVIGLPVWFVVGVLIALSDLFIEKYHPGAVGQIKTSEMLMWSYLGLSSGDLLSGLLSQLLKSRRRVIFLNLMGIVVLTGIYLFNQNLSPAGLKTMSYLLGLATGYWALFVTNASEQFGTNIRSTVTATVPNFVRGGVVPITLGFMTLAKGFSIVFWNVKLEFEGMAYAYAAIIVGAVCILLAIWGTYTVKESFHKELNYVEE